MTSSYRKRRNQNSVIVPDLCRIGVSVRNSRSRTYVFLHFLSFAIVSCLTLCSCVIGSGSGETIPELKYVWGDALNDPEALGPDGNHYPWEVATQIAGKSRIPRSLFGNGDKKEEPRLLTPEETRAALLGAFFEGEQEGGSFLMPNSAAPQAKTYHRKGRSESIPTASPSPPPPTSSPAPPSPSGCVPARLCETSYNTTAPMYGISLTSGTPVTIVQKFPDLLQQVVYQVCKSQECDVIQGECVQTYLPYLFLVIPLGPVTLTGQDYVLVESGCACRPKYAKKEDNQPPLPFITPFNTTAGGGGNKNNNNNHHPVNNKPRINKRF